MTKKTELSTFISVNDPSLDFIYKCQLTSDEYKLFLHARWLFVGEGKEEAAIDLIKKANLEFIRENLLFGELLRLKLLLKKYGKLAIYNPFKMNINAIIDTLVKFKEPTSYFVEQLTQDEYNIFLEARDLYTIQNQTKLAINLVYNAHIDQEKRLLIFEELHRLKPFDNDEEYKELSYQKYTLEPQLLTELQKRIDDLNVRMSQYKDPYVMGAMFTEEVVEEIENKLQSILKIIGIFKQEHFDK